MFIEDFNNKMEYNLSHLYDGINNIQLIDENGEHKSLSWIKKN